MKKFILYVFYWLWSCIWGCLMTIIGAIIALAMLISGHKPHHIGPNVYFVIGENWGGVNFGPFFLICNRGQSTSTLYHEPGHGLQNLIWGPLMPFVVAIPSAIRYWYRELKYYRKGEYPTTDYDSIWFEGQATRWGNKVYNRKENN